MQHRDQELVGQNDSRFKTLATVEREHILTTLKYTCKGNLRQAADLLGISRATMYRKINQYSKEGYEVC